MKKSTIAYNRFELTLQRTSSILESGIIGVDHNLTKINLVLDKFVEVKGVPGKYKKDYKPNVKIEKDKDGDTFRMSMDPRSAYLAKQAMTFYSKDVESIKNHLYSILLVYVWGAFETYCTMAFEELFNKTNEMLKSGETITYANAIDNKNGIQVFLIQKELEKIGHFPIDKLFEYLNSKINFSFSQTRQNNLKNIYFLRNIIAHNTGVINSKSRKSLPKGIKVVSEEIVITKKNLDFAQNTIQQSVQILEKFIMKKFFNKA